jgi:alanine dehydrogenase
VTTGVPTEGRTEEPPLGGIKWLQPHQIPFPYPHLAPDARQTHPSTESRATCVALETVPGSTGRLGAAS